MSICPLFCHVEFFLHIIGDFSLYIVCSSYACGIIYNQELHQVGCHLFLKLRGPSYIHMYAMDQKATCDIWEQYWDPQHYLLDLHGYLYLKFVESLLYVSSSSILNF